MFNTTWAALPNTVNENLCKPLLTHSMNHGEWLEFLDNEFAKYHASINAKGNGSYYDIIFESEKDYMFFILKWG